MPFDEGRIVRDALTLWEAQYRAMTGDFARRSPAQFRRGPTALLEAGPTPQAEARARHEERSLLDALAAQDPMAYDAALEQRIASTSFQETLDLIKGGRPRREA